MDPTDAKPEINYGKPNLLQRVGALLDDGLMWFFGYIAVFVAARPWKVIATMTVIAVLLGFGFARIKVETSAEKLYTPQGTVGFADRQYVFDIYGVPPVTNYIYATSPNRGTSNILTTQGLLAFLDLWNAVLSTSATYNGDTLFYNSSRICFRPGGLNTPCDFVSVLDYWNYSADAIRADADISATVSNANAVDGLGRIINPSQVMNLTRNTAGQIVSADAFKLTFVSQYITAEIDSSNRDDYEGAWEDAVVTTVRSYKSSAVEVWIDSQQASYDISSNTITGDISLLIIGYVLLVVYGLIVLFKNQSVESRSWMALANVGSIALAVLCTYGLVILCGVKFSLVVQVLALLLLGLGTDDMLVTMTAHEDTALEMGLDAPVVDRIRATVSVARRAVVVASLTNFVAFCTGTSSQLPALSDFMTFAAVGVIFVMIYQSTFFVACLTLDVRRQQNRRVDFLCCNTSKVPLDQGRCGGAWSFKTPSIAQRLIGEILPTIIINPIGKLAVTAVTLFFLVMGIIGCIKVKSNFDDQWFIPSNSWLATVYSVQRQYFPGAGTGAVPFDVYTKNLASPPLDYFDYQDELENLYTKLQADAYVTNAPPVSAWYPAFITWLQSSTYNSSLTSQGRPTTSPIFYESLHEFLGSAGKDYAASVVFSNSSSSVIESSYYRAQFISLPDSPSQVNGMNSVRAVAKNSAPSLDAIAYAEPFLFYAGYAVISGDTVLAVGVAAGCVFVICLLMLADFTACVSVGLMVALVDLELVGFLYWASLSFNSVTSINLLVAVGLAVDYAAFTAFSFMTRVGTRDERARAALRHYGVAVFNGGFTMFLAILPAAFAVSYIFQTFFKMFAMIVALGLWHALFALPVLLSFVGSPPYASALDREARLLHATSTQNVEKTDDAPQGPMQVPSSVEM